MKMLMPAIPPQQEKQQDQQLEDGEELEDGETSDVDHRGNNDNQIKTQANNPIAPKTVEQKLAALQKLKALKFGGASCSKINPFSVPVAEKKTLTAKESKELLENFHSRKQKETSDKNFPRRSRSPPLHLDQPEERQERLPPPAPSKKSHHHDFDRSYERNHDFPRPDSRERERSRETDRQKSVDSETRFRDRRPVSDFCRLSPPSARVIERRFKPPLEKERLRSLTFGFDDLEGQSRHSLEDAFTSLLTLESEVIDLWNQRRERLSLLKGTLLREREELCELQDKLAGGAVFPDYRDLDVATSYSPDLADTNRTASSPYAIVSTEATAVPPEPVGAPSADSPSMATSDVAEGPVNRPVPTISVSGPHLDSSPVIRFPSSPGSQGPLINQGGVSGSQPLYTEAGSQHLRLASFLARLPRVSSADKIQQPTRPSAPPPPGPLPPLPPSSISIGPPAGLRVPPPGFLPPLPPFRPPSPRGPPFGPMSRPLPPGIGMRLDVPVSQQMGPRFTGPGGVLLFPPPTAPPRPLLPEDLLVSPEVKRRRRHSPEQHFSAEHRNQKQKFRNRKGHRRRTAAGGGSLEEISPAAGGFPGRDNGPLGIDKRLGGGVGGKRNEEYPQLSEMVVVIPDDIQLKRDHA